MAWVKVDDRLPKGPKVKRAALHLGGKLPRRRVLAVWLQAMCYCNEQTTDGFIPDFEVADIEDEKPADVFAAMAHGDKKLGPIVERVEDRDGWVFRNYDEYQPTKAEIEKKRKADRKRQQRRRASQDRPRGVTRLSQRDTAVVTSLSVAPDPIRSGPAPQDQKQEEQRAGARRSPGQLRMVLRTMVEMRRHLRAACAHELTAAPDITDADLAQRLMTIAANDLHVTDYSSAGIYDIIRAVQGKRAGERPARRSAEDRRRDRSPNFNPDYYLQADAWRDECETRHGGRCNNAHVHAARMAVAS